MSYEQFLLALCLWREARGETQLARTGIAAVIRNRSEHAKRRWPNTIVRVILQPKQFSSFNAGDPNAVLFPVQPAAGASADWNSWQDCCDVATVPLQSDPTNGANCYESIPDGKPKPSWADPAKITTTIGPFRFYKL